MGDFGGGRGSIHLTCENCGNDDYFSPNDAEEDGFFSCSQCAAVNHSTQATGTDFNDFGHGNIIYTQRTQPTPTPTPRTRTLAHHLTPPTDRLTPDARIFKDFAQPSEPLDFAPSAPGPEELAAAIRSRYVQGLQVILQRQLEVLVERYRVSALVCGVAGPIWLRWVAASRVFDEMWALNVLKEDEAAQKHSSSGGGHQKPHEVESEWMDDSKPKKSGTRRSRRRIEFIFLRSLVTMLPRYSTLAVCFLTCHVAREAVLPTDIYRWGTEGKLPYVAAFNEVDKLLGSSPEGCPLISRQLFRPIRMIGAWQLEAAAASIAQRIGLQLPSVNFYSIAQRYLNKLSLPTERILPHACRIYEWAMPAELWLSSNPARIPTRVCVMAILIVALRIRYNINGQGIWEKVVQEERNAGGSDPDVNPPPFVKSDDPIDEKIGEEGRNADGSDPDVNPPASDDGVDEKFGTRELLCTLANAFHKIDVGHDYSKDLRSYLKYCNDVVFSGITSTYDADYFEKIFWNIYKGEKDETPKVHTDGTNTASGVNKRCQDGTSVASSGDDALQKLKSEMEDNGFYYMPPRERLTTDRRMNTDGYLHYKRKTVNGSIINVVHADYYILLRVFAMLAEVDVRIMHLGVRKVERRLAWTEERIGKSLDALQNLPSKENEEQGHVSDGTCDESL